MKIVNIIGGLGNQMFQYAFALALKARFPDEDVKYDISSFRGYGLHNGFELPQLFKLSLKQASLNDVCHLNVPAPHYKLWQIRCHILKGLFGYLERNAMVFDSKALEIKGSKYFDGYWQVEEYFKDCEEEVRREFTFSRLDEKNAELAGRIAGKCSVSVHIRRGDYLNNPNFSGLTDLSYYERAIRDIKASEKPEVFLIFSNDHKWCRENIAPLTSGIETVYVDWNTGENSFRDMQLMSLCKHNIIANSTFSWWGAWLNPTPDKLIITPKAWINNKPDCDIIPSKWKRL